MQFQVKAKAELRCNREAEAEWVAGKVEVEADIVSPSEADRWPHDAVGAAPARNRRK